MLLKSDLKRIASARLADADALFSASRFDGAAYLCGYVVEIVLKLRVCKTLQWEGFPESRKEFDGLASFKTHNLDALLHLSGVENKIKQFYFSDWSTVKAWDPESRYSRVSMRTKSETLQRRGEVLAILSATKTLLNVL
ncbi:hypothetical protein [Spirosoma utsteinense]|uniref:HEPN domain-containing protein n=1 Tax=Spirosoma utsteinense TaxID=2585773 RepID=A0ABR6W199_9BACT|nr:hypothetical protein [Spirosoma utsteinense]MBC3784997.1 hypothetical protein [Spirosoma utsteinense]MBC3790394.1 hypothetical protein [Spirosoma utsteinense]